MMSEHDEVLSAMQAAVEALATVEALDEPVTPASQRQYAQLLRMTTGFTLTWSLAWAVKKLGFNGAEEMADAGHRVRLKTTPIPGTLDDQPQPPGESERDFFITDFVQWILNPRRGTHTQGENEGFIRLMCGYHQFHSGLLDRLLTDAMKNMVQWTDLIALSTRIDGQEDPVERLIMREQFLERNPRGERLFSFLMFMIRTVHTLKFAFAYNALDREEKGIYLTAVFQGRREKEIAEMRRKTRK
ncbi:hypothetical protein LshimejAT787_2200610 [Lyophyllum shimeji]|uniref:Uncharacterized protein n=1 Tax=Lyophyllum shimeji TaxID=47721 RepID=A0A9P3UU98_LYOSH|nr:hypothetical protein LshimejAT787_2200610 [Lyophyllum shimeji]